MIRVKFQHGNRTNSVNLLSPFFLFVHNTFASIYALVLNVLKGIRTVEFLLKCLLT